MFAARTFKLSLYPIGLAGLQRPERLLTNLLSLSRSLPPYLPRVRHQAHIHDPFDEGLVPCLACLLLHAIGAAVNQITGLLPPRVWRAIRKKKGEKKRGAAPHGL